MQPMRFKGEKSARTGRETCPKVVSRIFSVLVALNVSLDLSAHMSIEHVYFVWEK